MNEIQIAGKRYISLKRAHALSGYTSDYLGQLCRAGKLNCKRVGRAWYVSEVAVSEHKKKYKQEQDREKSQYTQEDEAFSYQRDERALHPELKKEEENAWHIEHPRVQPQAEPEEKSTTTQHRTTTHARQGSIHTTQGIRPPTPTPVVSAPAQSTHHRRRRTRRGFPSIIGAVSAVAVMLLLIGIFTFESVTTYTREARDVFTMTQFAAPIDPLKNILSR